MTGMLVKSQMALIFGAKIKEKPVITETDSS